MGFQQAELIVLIIPFTYFSMLYVIIDRNSNRSLRPVVGVGCINAFDMLPFLCV